jgi:hypothetical protein
LLEQKNEKQKQAMKVKLNLSGFRKKNVWNFAISYK